MGFVSLLPHDNTVFFGCFGHFYSSRTRKNVLLPGIYRIIIDNAVLEIYRISSVIRRSFFFLPKQSQRSRSVLQDGSRSFGLFRKGKIGIIAKFHRTDLVI